MDLLNRDVWNVVAKFLIWPSTLGHLNRDLAKLVFDNTRPVLRILKVPKAPSKPLATRFRAAQMSIECSVNDANIETLIPSSAVVTYLIVFKETELSPTNLARFSATLTSLHVFDTPNLVTDEHLAQMPALTSLELFNSSISDRGVKNLAGKLKVLKITRYTNAPPLVTDAGLASVASTLHTLELDTVRTITDRGVRVRTITDRGVRMLTNLTALHVCNTQITDASLHMLTNLTSLTSVDNAGITDDGVSAVANSLKTLYVGGISLKITSDSIAKCTNLTSISLTREGTRNIVEALPRLQKLERVKLWEVDAIPPAPLLNLPKSVTSLGLRGCTLLNLPKSMKGCVQRLRRYCWPTLFARCRGFRTSRLPRIKISSSVKATCLSPPT